MDSHSEHVAFKLDAPRSAIIRNAFLFTAHPFTHSPVHPLTSKQVGPGTVFDAEPLGRPLRLANRNMAKHSPEPCSKSKPFAPAGNPGRYRFHFRLERQKRKNLRSGVDESKVVLPGRIIVEEKSHVEVFKDPPVCVRAVIFVQGAQGEKRLLRDIRREWFATALARSAA